MPCEIAWLPDAVKDLARLREFIQEKNPAAALRAGEKIKEAAAVLVANPEAGKPVEEALPFRDLFVPFGSGNYILRYRQEGNRIFIVRIRHSREQSLSDG